MIVKIHFINYKSHNIKNSIYGKYLINIILKVLYAI